MRAAPTDFPHQPFAWGIGAAEVATVGFVALRFGAEVIPDGAPTTLANLAPVLLGAGVGLAAHRWDFDPRPAYAMHGAVWAGVGMLALGAAFDGRHERAGLRLGAASMALAVVGAVGGGVLGATAGPRAPPAWMVAPTIGLGTGLVVGGAAVMLSGDLDGDRTVRRVYLGLGAGVTAAVIGGAIWGFTRPAGAAAATRALVPRIEPGPQQLVVSFGGGF